MQRVDTNDTVVEDTNKVLNLVLRISSDSQSAAYTIVATCFISQIPFHPGNRNFTRAVFIPILSTAKGIPQLY